MSRRALEDILFEASEAGDAERCMAALEAGASPNMNTPNGVPILHGSLNHRSEVAMTLIKVSPSLPCLLFTRLVFSLPWCDGNRKACVA